MDHTAFDKITAMVLLERLAQVGKWGVQSHTNQDWHVILGEEMGEVSREVFEQDIMGNDVGEKLKHELYQVIAVAYAWLEDILSQEERTKALDQLTLESEQIGLYD